MPQLDFLIWFLLTINTTFVFWIVYVLTLWIYRQLISSQCFILKLKNFVIFFFFSVLYKIILLLKIFFRKDYIFNEYILMLQQTYNAIKFNFFYNLFLFIKLFYFLYFNKLFLRINSLLIYSNIISDLILNLVNYNENLFFSKVYFSQNSFYFFVNKYSSFLFNSFTSYFLYFEIYFKSFFIVFLNKNFN